MSIRLMFLQISLDRCSIWSCDDKRSPTRNEFRGAHFKPEFPERDDKNWLKTTIATYDPHNDEPIISYRPIDLRYLSPEKRDYSKAKKIKPELKNIPKNITLPV